MENITPLFTIASLDHSRYPRIKSQYLARDMYLVHCDLLSLIGLLSSEEIRHQALGLPMYIPRVTEKRMSGVAPPPL